MKLNHFEDINQYYEEVKPYLIKQEGYHNLIFGIIAQLKSKSEFLTRPYLVTVKENDNLVAVAIKTSLKLVLSKSLNLNAFQVIAQDLQAQQELIPSVLAPVDEALSFAQAWQAITNQSYKLAIQHRVYQLETIKPILKAQGDFRQATLADCNFLINWCQAYIKEALGEVTEDNRALSIIENYLKDNALYLWQDEIPVSMAGYSGTSPNGIRVNFVYTPPKYRGNGYASSCVAALSQMLLDHGHKYCFLFTDLANSTSNHIYQEIGYQPVGDMHEYRFKDGNFER